MGILSLLVGDVEGGTHVKPRPNQGAIKSQSTAVSEQSPSGKLRDSGEGGTVETGTDRGARVGEGGTSRAHRGF